MSRYYSDFLEDLLLESGLDFPASDDRTGVR